MMETEQEALAAVVDTLNSWARELGGSETHNLREAAALADRLWAQCSRRIHNAETKAEAERTARQKAEAERDAALALVGRMREALAYALDQFHYDLPHSAGAISKGRKVLAEPVPSAEMVAAAMRERQSLRSTLESIQKAIERRLAEPGDDTEWLCIQADAIYEALLEPAERCPTCKHRREWALCSNAFHNTEDAAIERARGGENGS